MSEDDPNWEQLSGCAWIRVSGEWRPFHGAPPPDSIEAKAEYYGCDSGCSGYAIYLHREGADDPEQIGKFEFEMADSALKRAKRLALKLGMDDKPIVVQADWL